jgi:hypothetical protein
MAESEPLDQESVVAEQDGSLLRTCERRDRVRQSGHGSIWLVAAQQNGQAIHTNYN